MNKRFAKLKISIIWVSLIIMLVSTGIIVVILLRGSGGNSNEAAEKTCMTLKRYNREIEVCLEDYIGLPSQEALDLADEQGLLAVIIKIDGESQAITYMGRDLLFEIERGKVSEVHFGFSEDF